VSDERGPIEIRTATIESVSYPERIVELMAVPYDEPAVVEYRGRILEETVAAGAFGAISNRARKFLVNFNHNPDVWLGTVLALDSANTRGLRATIKMRRTPEGDQALDDCADELLGASVGMAVAPGDQRIDGTRRRISKAYLDHIALTPTPAYAGAAVLEVRSSPVVELALEPGATPNLERALALMARRDSFPPT
jgi:HK97 family phage prohead protease